MSVTLKDAIGRQIKPGSVLRHRYDGTRGVVEEIAELGRPAKHAKIVGDMAIQVADSVWRVTNCGDEWIHLEREWQTAVERWRSFMATPWEHDEGVSSDPSEAFAMEFAAALLPADPWEHYAAYPDGIELVLLQLARLLDQQK